MKPFDKIEAMAGKHHGGPKGISAALRQWPVDTDVGSKKDARYLAGMAPTALAFLTFSGAVAVLVSPGQGPLAATARVSR